MHTCTCLFFRSIVRNQILIDMQGEDVLMQIFTSCVMQRKAGQEAPFFEFIQRLCAIPKNKASTNIRPGCGGFGIRNFLTLFLSIEVSKAMADAKASTDEAEIAFHRHRVELFTSQLVESNPILVKRATTLFAYVS
jgi:4-hydroxyphenylpyruvate dioxygenase-like putative hemolysin